MQIRGEPSCECRDEKELLTAEDAENMRRGRGEKLLTAKDAKKTRQGRKEKRVGRSLRWDDGARCRRRFRIEGEGGVLKQFCGDEIFESVSNALEQGNVVGTGADVFLSRRQFMKVGDRVSPLNPPILKRNEKPPGSAKTPVIGADDVA